MKSRNLPIPVEFINSGVRKRDGSLLVGGYVVAMDRARKDTSSPAIPARKKIWQDSDGEFEWLDGVIGPLDSSGKPPFLVYAEGTYLFRLYDPAPGGGLPPDLDDYVEEKVNYFYAHEVLNVLDFGAVPDGPYFGGGAYNVAGPNGTLANSGDVMGTDNTQALQDAIDYCLGIEPGVPTPSGPFERPRSIYLPAGTYRITKPLRLWRRNAVPGTFDYFSLQIYGESRNVGFQDTTIFADFVDAPALMIQAGYGLTLRDLNIVGQNRVDLVYERFRTLHTQDPEMNVKCASDMWAFDTNFLFDWSQGGVPGGTAVGVPRDCVQSPYAGICIDPFGNFGPNNSKFVAPENRYAGFDAEYVEYLGSYSSAVVIQGCSIQKFVVGVMISPHGGNHNAENITIRDTSVASCRVGFAIAQAQTRNVNFDNCFLHECQFGIDTVSYGQGIGGTLPNIRGLSASWTKYLFNVTADSSSSVIEQVYCESTSSLGFISGGPNTGTNSITFSGCNFDFTRTMPMVDTHLAHYAAVAFVGCAFTVTELGTLNWTKYPPLSFFNQASLAFVNCSLNSGPSGPPTSTSLLDPSPMVWANNTPAIGFHRPDLVVFDGLRLIQNDGGGFTGGTAATFLRREYPGPILPVPGSLVRQHVPPGARIPPLGTDVHGSAGQDLRIVAGRMRTIPIGSVALQVADAESISFSTPSMVGRLLPGDIVYCPRDPVTRAGDGLTVPYYGDPVFPSPNIATPAMDPTKGYASDGPIGVVASVSTKQTVIRHVPRNFFKLVQDHQATPGYKLPLEVRRFGRYHPPTTGAIQIGSPVISNVALLNSPLKLAAAWKAYDRITDEFGHFVSGVYIKSVDETNMTITVSRPATSLFPGPGPSGARLFDADVLRYAGQPE